MWLVSAHPLGNALVGSLSGAGGDPLMEVGKADKYTKCASAARRGLSDQLWWCGCMLVCLCGCAVVCVCAFFL